MIPGACSAQACSR